ncbi:hypothetical protein [Maribacter sp. 2307UL18-2]|uniref:hypothetical protein n=1 Tax=Maribacter sp. 2307UL18-2 TaxID=3386274 RepID=UPI0039BD248C
MDLKKERQIKFWLTTISKVLIIALVLFKLIDVLFNNDESNGSDDAATTTTLENSRGGDTVATTPEETNTKEVVPSERQSKMSNVETKLIDKLDNEDTQTSETKKPKTNTTIKSDYAEMQLEEKGFIWLQESKKAVLQLSNPTLAEAKYLKATAVLDYGTQTKSVIFPERSTIGSKTTLTLETSLSHLPQTALPSRILLCITHGTSNLDKKTAHRYMLGNRISGAGAIEVRSYVYRVISSSKSFYSSVPPNCTIPKSTNNLSDLASSKSLAADENLEKIKSTARLFLNGLNNKSLMTIKNTSSKKLYDHIAKGDHKNYAYGFSTQVEVVSSSASSAIVRIGLTEKGRSYYLDFESNNSGTTTSSLFDFLQRDGGNWKGKLINQNGLWKFDFL